MSRQFTQLLSCFAVAQSITATLGQVLFTALEPSCDCAHQHFLFLWEALRYYPVLACTPRTDASKQGQNNRHSERPVYATATPLLENLCESSLEWEAANRSRRLRQTALCSLTLHYHLSWVCALSPQPRAVCARSWCIGLAWLPYSIHLAISVMRCSYLVPLKALLILVYASYLHHLHYPVHSQPHVLKEGSLPLHLLQTPFPLQSTWSWRSLWTLLHQNLLTIQWFHA